MKNLTFRFVFVLLSFFFFGVLEMFDTPVVEFIRRPERATVGFFNAHLLHIRPILNEEGFGSGDTSYAWAQFATALILSLLGALIWTAIARNSTQTHQKLRNGLNLVLRYYLLSVSCSYGAVKLFALQMPFPNLSQLATPLGDFLPMRLLWMSMGYGAPYQVFAGVMEMAVGLLFISRRTTTLGALLGAGVYANVFMLNLSYDVPVKLFSMQLLVLCLYLLFQERKRLLQFFVHQSTAEPTAFQPLELKALWQRRSRWVLKTLAILLLGLGPVVGVWMEAPAVAEEQPTESPVSGMYRVSLWVQNGDTLPCPESRAVWQDFVFDLGGAGSILTNDTLFRQAYGRGYFFYENDTVLNRLLFYNQEFGKRKDLFALHYETLDAMKLGLSGTVREDSLHFVLEPVHRHFPLAERQFHWISEANR